MKPDFETIDSYLNGELSDKEKKEIELKIKQDQLFAREFTFALLSKKAAKEDANKERKEQFEEIRTKLELAKNKSGKIIKFQYSKWAIAAAASVILILGITIFNNQKPNHEYMANSFIDENLTTLPVLMGTETDSLQMGIQLYNKKAYTEAEVIFEKIAYKVPKALEYQGLTALQLENYDKALIAFQKLAQNEIFKSRGQLLQALTLIKKGDKTQYFEIIKAINKNNLSIEEREFIEDMAIKN
jgi:hypothetical protein